MNQWERKDKRIGRLAIFKSIYEAKKKFGKDEITEAEKIEQWVIEDGFDENRDKSIEEQLKDGKKLTKDQVIKGIQEETPF